MQNFKYFTVTKNKDNILIKYKDKFKNGIFIIVLFLLGVFVIFTGFKSEQTILQIYISIAIFPELLFL